MRVDGVNECWERLDQRTQFYVFMDLWFSHNKVAKNLKGMKKFCVAIYLNVIYIMWRKMKKISQKHKILKP